MAGRWVGVGGRRCPALGVSALQQRDKLHGAKVGLELLAVILVFEPGPALGRGPAVEDQPCRPVVVLDLDDGLLELVGVGLLRLLLPLGVIILRPLLAVAGLGVGLAGQRIDGVGITVAVLVTALVLQELAQQLTEPRVSSWLSSASQAATSSGFFL